MYARMYKNKQVEEKKKKGSPCICPIINSLSNRSVPARTSNFPALPSRNFRLRPMNQFSQNGLVADRSVRQTHGFAGSVGWDCLWRSGGTETRAEVLLRIVRERVLFVLVGYWVDGGRRVMLFAICIRTAILSRMIKKGIWKDGWRGTSPCLGELLMRNLYMNHVNMNTYKRKERR